MSKREWLVKEALESPDVEVDQVVNFFLFIKKSHDPKQFEALMLSYSTLSKGWFSDEEEEAWKDYQ